MNRVEKDMNQFSLRRRKIAFEMKRKTIELDYKPFNSENVNYTFNIINNMDYIDSETLENRTFSKPIQEQIAIEMDLLEKMSNDAKDIIRIMLIAPREFLFVLSQITSISRRGVFTANKNSNHHTLKRRFRIWLMRFLKAKYNYGNGEADINAGKIIREIKELVY